MVRRLDDPIDLEGLARPTTKGDWARFMVGGEKLECKEASRYSSFPDCSFVWEHIDEVQQGPQDVPNQ
eukprot:4190022-Karenia_brevis.AAC.1